MIALTQFDCLFMSEPLKISEVLLIEAKLWTVSSTTLSYQGATLSEDPHCAISICFQEN